MVPSPQSSYLVSIRNRSGVTSNYAIIFAPPAILPPIDPIDVSVPIVCAFKNVPSENGTIVFEIPKEIHAVCGTAIFDTAKSGPVQEIFHQMPVTCARFRDDGSIEPGTSLRVSTEIFQPAFVKDVAHSVKPGTFSIQTQMDFTAADARQSTLILGPLSCQANQYRRILRWDLWTLAGRQLTQKVWLLFHIHTKAQHDTPHPTSANHWGPIGRLSGSVKVYRGR